MVSHNLIGATMFPSTGLEFVQMGKIHLLLTDGGVL